MTSISVNVSQLVQRSNYRQEYDQQLIDRIAGDMAQHGYKVEWPITVYANDNGTYTIIDGHTRYLSAMQAALYNLHTHAPTLTVWIVVKDKPSDKGFALDQLASNSLRRDPDPISDAIGFKNALDEGATLDEVANAIGHSKQYVEDRVKLLTLIPDARELVAHKQIGIRYALCMVDLDTNFQHIALRAYSEGKAHSVDTFNAICSTLLQKQRTCSLFDLALFSGKPIEQVIDIPQLPKEPTKAELMAQLIAERHAHENSKQAARRAYQSIKAELGTLRAQLDEMRIPA